MPVYDRRYHDSAGRERFGPTVKEQRTPANMATFRDQHISKTTNGAEAAKRVQEDAAAGIDAQRKIRACLKCHGTGLRVYETHLRGGQTLRHTDLCRCVRVQEQRLSRRA